MLMDTQSLAAMDREPFSRSESFEGDFHGESPCKEVVTQYFDRAPKVMNPCHSDRIYRLLEMARISRHDFGLDWNDTYEVTASFNQSHVIPPVDNNLLKNIMDIVAVDHYADKPLGWRLYASPMHLEGEYNIQYHAFVLSTDDPNSSAKAFLRSRCSVQGMPRIRFFQDNYWDWNGCHYVKVEVSKIRYRLEKFLEMAVVITDDGPEPFPTTPKVLDAIMVSVQGKVFLANEVQLPFYLGAGEPPEASDSLIFGQSKTLCLRNRAVFDSQPYWFSTGTLALDPDPYAPESVEWNKFLSSVFGDDQLSKDLLHEFMGLTVAGDTTLQKMLLMIGPPRSGKGTIVGVMEKLVGLGNYCALTIGQLSDKFGLADIPGKKLIEMNEAYFDGKSSNKKAVERLLSLIGRDMVVSERKYKNPISVRADGCFVMSTNKLPNLVNVGSALSARFLPLVFNKSFVGSEDISLAAKFETELPGILNLALDGLERLRYRGYFVLPESSEDMLARMRSQFDPLAEFIKEKCNRQGRCSVQQFLDAYNRWREGQDMEPVIASELGRELLSYSGIKKRQGTGGARFYEGVELKQ